MSYQSKQNTTIFIWIATTIISIFALMSEGWVVSIPLGVALFATVAIWASGNESKENRQTTISNIEKKSDSTAYTMALLMEMMDDYEREEFKSQLKQRILSGESVTDASIIQEMEKRKRG